MRDKIIELFEYRELPKLIATKSANWDDDYYEKLISLQYNIYLLDHVLETNWEVNMDLVAQKWTAIHNDLSDLGVPSDLHDKYCSHIYKYQKHELEIRQTKFPTRLSMEYFYFYKSCDVKLLRRIIYDNNPALRSMVKTSEWRLFDLVTEVNDDVVDLQEDLDTINGNRFLISLVELGKEKTRMIFANFLNEILDRNNQLTLTNDIDIPFQRWTTEQIQATLVIMDAQIKAFDQLDVSKYRSIVDGVMV